MVRTPQKGTKSDCWPGLLYGVTTHRRSKVQFHRHSCRSTARNSSIFATPKGLVALLWTRGFPPSESKMCFP